MADIQLIQCNQQKTSSYRRNSVPYKEIWIKESNDDARTLTGSSYTIVAQTAPCYVQNSLCVQVLRYHILAALLHGTPAAGLNQTLRHGTRNGIMELSQRARPIFGWVAITLGIGPHSSLVINLLQCQQYCSHCMPRITCFVILLLLHGYNM